MIRTRLTTATLVTALMTTALLLAATSGGCSSDDAPPDPAVENEGGAGSDEGSTTTTHGGDAGGDTSTGPMVECAIGAAIEVEPNDTPATANAFTELAFCGVLATGTDVDYFTFDTGAGKKLSVFQAVIDGKVDFELTSNGVTFGPSETSKFGTGTYVVKAFTKAGKAASYRIRVQFDAP